jgi:hypothetical protein
MKIREGEGNNFQRGGRYLYADYTPLDQNIDFLSQLKDFSSLADVIFQAHNDFEHLRTVLANAESLESEIVSKVDQLSRTLGDIFGNFSMIHNDPLRQRYSIPNEADPFVIASSTLKSNIIHSREVFLKQSEIYRRYIYSRIDGSLNRVLEPLNELISKGYEKLPHTMAAYIQKGLQISIDNTFGDSKRYNILLTNTLPPNSSSFSGTRSSISYSISIRSTEIEFWNQRRKVSDFGLKDIMIPVGLKTPIIKKLRKSFDFLPGLDKEVKTQRAPKYINVEGYYVYSATTDSNENLLIVLVDDPSKPDDKLIRIKYRIPELNYDERLNTATDATTNTENVSGKHRIHYLEHNKLPRIDFVSLEEGKVQDLLGIKDVSEATDIAEILLLGRAILDKMALILHHEPSRLALYSKLNSIQVDDKDALVVDSSKSYVSVGNNNIAAYDPSLITVFLETVARYYSPTIRKLREKSPMKNELILRFENADGSREEHSLGIEELNLLLKRTGGGKKIAKALEIYPDGDNDIHNNMVPNNDSQATRHTEQTT